MLPLNLLLPFGAQHDPALAIETDIPLVIQGFIMIALAAIPLFLSGRERRTQQDQSNQHDQALTQMVTTALSDALHREQDQNYDLAREHHASAQMEHDLNSKEADK